MTEFYHMTALDIYDCVYKVISYISSISTPNNEAKASTFARTLFYILSDWLQS